ncbi:MAG: hypothetical protein H7Z19_01940 [Chitinophagaceae bacterium]|nr:hypothetical protein [Rubrivivax sp.]
MPRAVAPCRRCLLDDDDRVQGRGRNLAQPADLVRQRLQLIDSLRLSVFGRTR